MSNVNSCFGSNFELSSSGLVLQESLHACCDQLVEAGIMEMHHAKCLLAKIIHDLVLRLSFK